MKDTQIGSILKHSERHTLVLCLREKEKFKSEYSRSLSSIKLYLDSCKSSRICLRHIITYGRAISTSAIMKGIITSISSL